MSVFPDRKSLSRELKSVSDSDGYDYDVEISHIENQKTYTWVRIYLNDEIEIEKNSEVQINYLPTNEKVNLTFICFNKSKTNRSEEDIEKYSDEEDKKILCCMIDLNTINKNSQDIPFIRTLFKSSIWHCQQIYRRDDMIVTNNSNKLSYYHIDF